MEIEGTPIYLVNFENYLRPKDHPLNIRRRKPIHHPPPPIVAFKSQEEKSSFDLFCESTSIHGFNMLALTKNRPRWERVCWLLIILTAISLAVFFLYEALSVNANTPTVTYIETTHYPAYTAPFPAVTLCTLNKISHEKGMRLANKFATSSNLSLAETLRLFQIPFYVTHHNDPRPDDFRRFDEVLAFNNYSLLQFLMEVSSDCMQEMVRCQWNGRTAPCDFLFEPILMPRGRCCSFNYYARPINRTLRNIQSLTPIGPRHVSGSGPETGLTVLIDPRADDYMEGFITAPGYRAIIHDAYDYPEDNSDNVIFPIQSETYIGVKTTVTYGTKYLRNMGFLTRGCTFDPEHPLKFFTEYSFWNCLAECLSLRVMKNCGCIPHHMPRTLELPLCNLTVFDCISRETELFKNLLATTNILGTPICGCMPECSLNKYRTTTTTAPLNRTFSKGQTRFFKNTTITDQILLHIFFVDLTCMLLRTDALDSWQSVVGTVGGITGLTMGFSAVSLLEAFFFLCVRPLYLKCAILVTRVKARRHARLR